MFGNLAGSDSENDSTDFSHLTKKERKELIKKKIEEQKQAAESPSSDDASDSSSEASFDIEDDTSEAQEANKNDPNSANVNQLIDENEEDEGWQMSSSIQNKKQAQAKPNSNPKSDTDDIYQKKYKKLLKEYKFVQEQNTKLKREFDIKQADILN